MKNSIDPFTVEVIRHALTAAAEEMSFVVMRSARSPLLREAGDLSSALTDHKGDLIAQGRDIPIHLGVMSFTVKKFLERVPAERLQPGDVWYLNLPEVGGNHLPDVKAIRPIFLEGRLFAFAVSLAHWGDIGGAWAGSYFAAATETWQEGVRIPPLRLFTAQTASTRRSSTSCSPTCAARPNARATSSPRWRRRGRPRRGWCGSARSTAPPRSAPRSTAWTICPRHRCARRSRACPTASTRARISWTTTGPADSRRACACASRSRATMPASTSAPATMPSRGRSNTTPFVAMAAVYYAIKAVAGPEIQPNGGCYRTLEVITRPGSLFEPAIDKPVVGGNHETSNRAVDAIMRALEPAVPERLTAGGSTTAGILIFGGRRRDGAMGTFYETHGGGEGARAHRDGVPVVRVHLTNTMNTPAEIVEAEYMIRVDEQRLRPDSAGAGKHKGGAGLLRSYTVLADGMSLTTMFERRIVPPYGLQGGDNGAPFRVTLHHAAGGSRELRGKENLSLSKGDRVVMETSGGGGYGPPQA